MGKINRALLMLIAMGAIMLTAVGVDRGMQHFEHQRLEAERVARYEQAYADVADIEMTISQLARDQEAIEAYLEEHRDYFEDMEEFAESMGDPIGNASDGMSGGFGGIDISGSVSENGTGGVSANAAGDVSANETGNGFGTAAGSVSENQIEGISGNGTGYVSANALRDISGNGLTGIFTENIFQVSGNELWSVDGDYKWDPDQEVWRDVSGNIVTPLLTGENQVVEDASAQQDQGQDKELTLTERRKIRGSYMETRMQNKLDQEMIAQGIVDFSGISIACLGDSITEAANLSDQEDYKQYAYPARLKEKLGAENVVNLGIGGSSIGRYWENAFVDRYREIPQDTDLILVMGGTNDGFCMNQEELGDMQERKPRTFIGDLDELLRGLKENYPQARVVLVTPLPNVLHDILRKEREYLLPQKTIVNAMKTLAGEYGIPVIDLYNSNILDTHDAAVIYNYMPDGVHCNEEGYTLLAEHLGAELIRLYQDEEDGEA